MEHRDKEQDKVPLWTPDSMGKQHRITAQLHVEAPCFLWAHVGPMKMSAVQGVDSLPQAWAEWTRHPLVAIKCLSQVEFPKNFKPKTSEF